MSRRHGLAEVVVVVDGQQVAVHVGVADHHLHVGDAVDVQYELVELLELAGLDAVDREAAKLGAILQSKREAPLEAETSGSDSAAGRGKGDVSTRCHLSEPSD